MKVIEDFLKQYNKEFDFYQKLSLIISNYEYDFKSPKLPIDRTLQTCLK